MAPSALGTCASHSPAWLLTSKADCLSVKDVEAPRSWAVRNMCPDLEPVIEEDCLDRHVADQRIGGQELLGKPETLVSRVGPVLSTDHAAVSARPAEGPGRQAQCGRRTSTRRSGERMPSQGMWLKCPAAGGRALGPPTYSGRAFDLAAAVIPTGGLTTTGCTARGLPNDAGTTERRAPVGPGEGAATATAADSDGGRPWASTERGTPRAGPALAVPWHTPAGCARQSSSAPRSTWRAPGRWSVFLTKLMTTSTCVGSSSGRKC